MLFISTIVAAVINIVLNIILIPIFEAQGAAIATFFSYFIVWLVRLLDTRKIIKLDINIKSDILSYLLIILQIIITLVDFQNSFIISGFILLLIVILNRTFLKQIINYGITLIKGRVS